MSDKQLLDWLEASLLKHAQQDPEKMHGFWLHYFAPGCEVAAQRGFSVDDANRDIFSAPTLRRAILDAIHREQLRRSRSDGAP